MSSRTRRTARTCTTTNAQVCRSRLVKKVRRIDENGFLYHFGWIEKDAATRKMLRKGLENLHRTAEEEDLSHLQLVDARNGIKQLCHRMFQTCNTISACEEEILESTAVSQIPAASPFNLYPEA